MGLLDRAIKKGIGNAISSAVEKVVAPKAEQVAASVVNQAADSVNQSMAQNLTQPTQTQQSAVNQESVNQMINFMREAAHMIFMHMAANEKIDPLDARANKIISGANTRTIMHKLF